MRKLVTPNQSGILFARLTNAGLSLCGEVDVKSALGAAYFYCITRERKILSAKSASVPRGAMRHPLLHLERLFLRLSSNTFNWLKDARAVTISHALRNLPRALRLSDNNFKSLLVISMNLLVHSP